MTKGVTQTNYLVDNSFMEVRYILPALASTTCSQKLFELLAIFRSNLTLFLCSSYLLSDNQSTRSYSLVFNFYFRRRPDCEQKLARNFFSSVSLGVNDRVAPRLFRAYVESEL